MPAMMPGAQAPPVTTHQTAGWHEAYTAPPQPQTQRDALNDPACTLFVGQVPVEVERMTLEALFAQHGTVVECAVIKDKETRVSKGYAFVTMSGAHEATAAMHALDGFLLAGRRLKVAPKV